MNWKVGDLAIFRGRLVEVVWIHSGYGLPISVELTDDGGIVHSYTTSFRTDLTPLAGPNECVLDAIRRAAVPPPDKFTKMRRTAELWLAEPQVGDTFFTDNQLVELVEIGEGGTIWASITASKCMPPGPTVGGISFAGVRELRRWMSSDRFPPYKAKAIKSLRPDDGHKKTPRYRGV